MAGESSPQQHDESVSYFVLALSNEDLSPVYSSHGLQCSVTQHTVVLMLVPAIRSLHGRIKRMHMFSQGLVHLLVAQVGGEPQKAKDNMRHTISGGNFRLDWRSLDGDVRAPPTDNKQ